MPGNAQQQVQELFSGSMAIKTLARREANENYGPRRRRLGLARDTYECLGFILATYQYCGDEMVALSTGTNTLGRTTQTKQKLRNVVRNAVILYNCESDYFSCRTAVMTVVGGEL